MYAMRHKHLQTAAILNTNITFVDNILAVLNHQPSQNAK